MAPAATGSKANPAKAKAKAPKKTEAPKPAVVAIVASRRDKKKKRAESFNTYIYKVLRQISDAGISTKSMSIMNSFVNDIFARIATEASKLASNNKRSTMITRDIQFATKLVLDGDLSRQAVSEGFKALEKYNMSKK